MLLVFYKVFSLFLEKGDVREKRREIALCGCLSHAPTWGPGLQPRHVSWVGLELVTPWFAGWHSIHWATPARATSFYWHIFQVCLGVSLNLPESFYTNTHIHIIKILLQNPFSNHALKRSTIHNQQLLNRLILSEKINNIVFLLGIKDITTNMEGFSVFAHQWEQQYPTQFVVESWRGHPRQP